MNTQNTPVHIKLWHREFWQMSIANLLLNMSAYMLIPVMPLWLMETGAFTPLETGICMGLFGVGLYLLGGFCSYLIERFRRNQVCLWSIVGMLLSLGLLLYLNRFPEQFAAKEFVMVQRLFFGAFFGLAQMVLSSTLIIDISESFQRTEANYSSSWFSRFALALGPMTGILLYRLLDFEAPLYACGLCCVVSILLISLVRFPFRAPEDDVKTLSLDRFFLPNGKWLFLNMLLVTTAMGLLMTMALTDWFYALMMGGFLLAILAERFVFAEAELKSEIITGLILMTAGVFIMLVQAADSLSWLSPLCVGLSVGLIGSRFLLFFIKLSRHCQRGTSQSMFMLSWESGLSLGLFIGYAFLYGQHTLLCVAALILIVISLLFYNFFTHSWFVSHKNR